MAGALSVAQGDAVSLLEELDYEDAGDWSPNKILATLKKLKKEVEDPAEADISKKNKKLLLAVVKAKNIELESEEAEDEEEEDDEEEEAPKKKSAKKKASGAKTKSKTSEKEKPTKKAKKKGASSEPAGKDDFGSRLGTEAAEINAYVMRFGKKGISAEKVVANFPKLRSGRVSAHLRWQRLNGWTKVKNDKIFVK